MFEVNCILIKALMQLLQRKISLTSLYTSGIRHACATQWHLSLIALSNTKKMDLSVRSVLSMRACYIILITEKIFYAKIPTTITFLSRKWSDVDWWHCNVKLTVGLLSSYHANQEKKPVACPALVRMLFQLLAVPGSQAKKRKRRGGWSVAPLLWHIGHKEHQMANLCLHAMSP